MCIELRRAGIPFDREKVYALEYLGENVGTYQADIVVDNKIILELKSVMDFHPCMNAHGQSQNTVSISLFHWGLAGGFNQFIASCEIS
jgi:GxxExxY protein